MGEAQGTPFEGEITEISLHKLFNDEQQFTKLMRIISGDSSFYLNVPVLYPALFFYPMSSL